MIRNKEYTLTIGGSIFYFELSGLTLGTGQYILLSRDITETKGYMDDYTTLLRALDQCPISIVITDPDGKIHYVNTQFEQVTGYTYGEVFGKNPRVLSTGEKTKAEYVELWKTILS